MYVASYKIPVIRSAVGVFLSMTMFMPVYAKDHVQFSTQNNLLTIPFVIIDDQQMVYDVEMHLQPNGQFALTEMNKQPSLQTGLDEEFNLQMDQSIWLKDTNIRLKLVAVLEDSRCPIEAICIWEGQVSLVFALYQASAHTHDFQLTLGRDNTLAYTDIENFRITLIQVLPIPSLITTIPTDYVAKLVIKPL